MCFNRFSYRKEKFSPAIKYFLFTLLTGHEGTEREGTYSLNLSLTSALDGGGCSVPRPGRLFPGKVSWYPFQGG